MNKNVELQIEISYRKDFKRDVLLNVIWSFVRFTNVDNS